MATTMGPVLWLLLILVAESYSTPKISIEDKTLEFKRLDKAWTPKLIAAGHKQIHENTTNDSSDGHYHRASKRKIRRNGDESYHQNLLTSKTRVFTGKEIGQLTQANSETPIQTSAKNRQKRHFNNYTGASYPINSMQMNRKPIVFPPMNPMSPSMPYTSGMKMTPGMPFHPGMQYPPRMPPNMPIFPNFPVKPTNSVMLKPHANTPYVPSLPPNATKNSLFNPNGSMLLTPFPQNFSWPSGTQIHNGIPNFVTSMPPSVPKGPSFPVPPPNSVNCLINFNGPFVPFPPNSSWPSGTQVHNGITNPAVRSMLPGIPVRPNMPMHPCTPMHFGIPIPHVRPMHPGIPMSPVMPLPPPKNSFPTHANASPFLTYSYLILGISLLILRGL